MLRKNGDRSCDVKKYSLIFYQGAIQSWRMPRKTDISSMYLVGISFHFIFRHLFWTNEKVKLHATMEDAIYEKQNNGCKSLSLYERKRKDNRSWYFAVNFSLLLILISCSVLSIQIFNSNYMFNIYADLSLIPSPSPSPTIVNTLFIRKMYFPNFLQYHFLFH